LIDYDSLAPEERRAVDDHLSACSACREYLAMLRDLDAMLSTQVHRLQLDSQRLAEIRQRATVAEPISRLSRMPEWLDFVAAAAFLAFASGLAWQAGLFALAASVWPK
jgi:anti-sigma factor RsiW